MKLFKPLIHHNNFKIPNIVADNLVQIIQNNPNATQLMLESKEIMTMIKDSLLTALNIVLEFCLSFLILIFRTLGFQE